MKVKLYVTYLLSSLIVQFEMLFTILLWFFLFIQVNLFFEHLEY